MERCLLCRKPLFRVPILQGQSVSGTADSFLLRGGERVHRIEQDSKIRAQRKECRIDHNEAEDAGRPTPVKDDNEVMGDSAH
jgi:hypothetical protein